MDYTWIISGSFIFLGLALLFYFATRRKYHYHDKDSHIEHYEDVRDKVTVRQKPQKEEEEYSYSGFSLGNIIGGFIAILVGVELLPVISKQVNDVQYMNVTGTSSIFAQQTLQLVPALFIIGIIIAALGIFYSTLHSSGVI